MRQEKAGNIQTHREQETDRRQKHGETKNRVSDRGTEKERKTDRKECLM